MYYWLCFALCLLAENSFLKEEIYGKLNFGFITVGLAKKGTCKKTSHIQWSVVGNVLQLAVL